MNFAGLFLWVVFGVPFIGLCIWGLREPEDYYDYFNKWRYERSPELTEFSIDMIRFQSGIGIFFAVVVLIMIIRS